MLNPEEVVAQGVILFSYFKDIKIHDIIINEIGTSLENGNFDVIIPKGTVFPLRNSFLFKYSKKYKFKNFNKNLKNINVWIYVGNINWK